jgi:predicted nucleic acid-binding protein
LKIILDLNIIISALIKESVSRKIIFNPFLDFYFPETAFHKIIKYKKYIMEKSKIGDNELLILLIRLFSHITLVSRKRLVEFKRQAKEIMKLIDDEDSIFIAAALSLGDDVVIWSDDKHFEKQERIKVWKTIDVIGKFKEGFGNE